MKSNSVKSQGATPSSNIQWAHFLLNPSNDGETATVFEGFGTQTVELALATNADAFTISQNLKEARIALQNTKSFPPKPQAIAYTEFKRESLGKQIMLGSNQARKRSHTIVVNRAALIRIKQNLRAPISTLPDLLYFLDKELIPTEVNYGNQIPKQVPNFLATRLNNFKQYWAYFFGAQKSKSKIGFVVTALLGLIFLFNTSQEAGISGDEFIQHEYGKVIASYHLKKIGIDIPIDTMDLKGQKMQTIARAYADKGSDIATLEDPEKLMHLYGSSFDTFCSMIVYLFDIEDYMEFRHGINALFGWLLFLFGALIARRVTHGSWLWATVAFILLFFTPRIFGEALNNPKDIPFALGYVMSIYYAMKVFYRFPHYRSWDIVGLVFGLALGISIRIGGLLTIGIVGIYLGLKYIQHIGWTSFIQFKWTQWKPWLIAFSAVSIIAYLIGVYVWPYGWAAPIDNPLKALSAFTDFEVSLRQLFQGVLYDSDKLPSHYLVHYIWITLPIGTLLGLGIYLIISLLKRKEYSPEEFILLFSAVFPVFYIWYKDSSVYGGLRHILFTLPSLILLAVLGFRKLQTMLPKGNIIAPILALLPVILPAKFVFQNQNLSYIYFNETIGGIDGAYGNYELDYYLASLKPSSEYLIKEVLEKNPTEKFKIVSYGMDQVRYYLRKYPNAQVGFTRFDDRGDKSWDYAVFYNAYMDQFRLQNGYYPPIGSVFAPEIDGKAVGCVIKRPSNADFLGIQKLTRENNPREAISQLKSYLTLDSTSSEIWFYLANAYATMQNIDSALIYANKSLHVFHENSRSLFLKYQLHLNKNQTKEAIDVMDNYIASRPKDPDGYVMKAQAQLLQKDYYGSVESVQLAIPFNPFDERIYRIGTQAYQYLKDNNNTSLWYSAAMFKSAKTQQEQSNSLNSIQRIYQNATGEELDLSKYFR